MLQTTRTDVGSGATVLHVAKALGGNGTRDTDRCAAVRNAGAEGANVARLVAARQAEVVVLAVHGDVLRVLLGKLLDRGLDVFHAARLAHLLGRVVRVAAGAVPVALERLGVEGDLDAPLLGDAHEQVAGHPEVVAHRDALARADLVFPLGGHHLGVDAGDVDARVQARAVVRLNEVASEHLAGTYMPLSAGSTPEIFDGTRTSTAVIGALRAGETALRPAVRRAVDVEQGVLLFDTEPWDVFLGEVHHLLGVVAVVGLVRRAIVVIALCHDEDVVTTAEGILEDRRRAKVHIGIMAGRLVRRRAVEVPDAQGADIGHLLRDGLRQNPSQHVALHLTTGHGQALAHQSGQALGGHTRIY
jgi:hypothetical protein